MWVEIEKKISKKEEDRKVYEFLLNLYKSQGEALYEVLNEFEA